MSLIQPIELKAKNGHGYILRSPQPEDGPALLEVGRTIMKTSDHLLTEPDEFKHTEEQESEVLRSYLQHPDKLWIVPEIEGKILGCLNFAPGGRRRIAHQGSFGVSILPEFRGMGIGRAMIEALLEWAESNPRLEMVRLKVHAKNTEAVHLYKTLGFIEEGREINGVKLAPNIYDDVIAMAKSVLR